MRRASEEALHGALAAADTDLAEAAACIEAQVAGTSAAHARLATERRRRIVTSLTAALERRAAEATLLLLVCSQRERLEAAALELAAVRHAAATQRHEPELEAAWLKPPPVEPLDGAPPGDSDEAAAAIRREHDQAVATWRREWIEAMAHSL